MKNRIRSRVRYEKIVRFFETQSERSRVVIILLALLGLVGIFLAVDTVSARFSTVVPASGGTLREGVVGFPRVINPIFAESNAEQDVSALVYSGLMKRTKNGLAPNLAKEITVGEEGLTYTATLRENIVFHDGENITSDDVVFTIEEIQNPTNESPLIADWSGVTAKALDDRTVQFTLDEPYSPFPENLTVGIIPKHLWRDASPNSLPFLELGNRPIGSGPFMIEDLSRNELGVISSYRLEPFEQHTSGQEAYLDSLELHFFEDQEALFDAFDAGAIDTMALVASSTLDDFLNETSYDIHTAPMPRSFGLFWNQNNNQLFVDRNVRRALALAVDRKALVDSVFSGYAEPLTGPLPSYALAETDIEPPKSSFDPEKARELLANDGWEKNSQGVLELDDTTLSFTITTIDMPELEQTAEFLKRSFEEIGANVTIETKDIGLLSRDNIRTREYEALLFGLAYNHGFDLAPFFHSSNTQDPGLNVALYTNSAVDDALETIQETADSDPQLSALETALEEIHNDRAALFLYSPKFTYVTAPHIQGISLPPIANAYERFSTISDWFVNTERIFTIFNR